mgnify:CR=1 FL=1
MRRESSRTQPRDELNELAMIYANRGLDQELAMTVAEQLSAHDRLGAHMRDELGIDQALSRVRCKRRGYRPRALPPSPCFRSRLCSSRQTASRIPAIAALSLVSLGGLGALGGHLGGAPLGRAALRVTIGGALAMAVTAAIGRLFGVAAG